MTARPLPEALALTTSADRWSIENAPTESPRDAHADPAARKLRAPLHDTDGAREARRLAMVRAALDPLSMEPIERAVTLTATQRQSPSVVERISQAANTMRVQHYAQTMHLARVDTLSDPLLVPTMDSIGARATTDPRARAELVALWAEAQTTADARKAARAIRRADPTLADQLQKVRGKLRQTLEQLHEMPDYWNDHQRRYENQSLSFHALNISHQLASTLLEAIGRTAEPDALDMVDDNIAEPFQPGNGEQLWHRLIPWRGTLSHQHTGLMARSNRKRVDHGRIIHDPSRLYTDPMRRAFYRRTRGNGATIVVDISGSMSLNVDDLTAVLRAAPGARVFAYRTGYHATDPTIWQLADNGRSVDLSKPLPVSPGGSNGVDGPALRYAVARHTAGEPFLWITDGRYNGLHRAAPDAELAFDILDAIQPVPELVTYAYIGDAEIALDRVARGGQMDPPSIPWSVKRHLARWKIARATR